MSRRAGKPLLRRAAADADVAEALDHYLGESVRAALGFVDALERRRMRTSDAPATGSPRYAHELNLPGLRFWRCKRYPHLVFYVEQAEHIEIWRVLHGARDIPRWLTQDDEPAKPAGD